MQKGKLEIAVGYESLSGKKITEWPRQREVVLEEKNHDARLAADAKNFKSTI